MDESKNVFLVDDVRKINLKVTGTSPFFDILEPETLKPSRDSQIKAVGPANGKMKCALVKKGEGSPNWNEIRRQGAFFIGKLNLESGAEAILCEGESSGKSPVYFGISAH